MFLRTVMCGHRAYDWNTMPMFRLSGDRLTRRSASNTVVVPNSTRPAFGVSSPARHRNVVVLPHPLGPSRTRNSPSSISRSKSSTGVVGGLPSKRLVIEWMLTWDTLVTSLAGCVDRGGDGRSLEQAVPLRLVVGDVLGRENGEVLHSHLVNG